MRLLIENIKTLVGIEEPGKPLLSGLAGSQMDHLSTLDEAWLLSEDGIIHSFGKMSDPPQELRVDETINAKGRIVLPTWCDSHTHLVFAAPREQEFQDRIKGLSYAEIAARGGGILNSAQKLNETSFDQLYEDALARLHQVIDLGTGAIEIKSGYGLSVEGEIKMLRVIKKLKEQAPIPIKASFLAAHDFPPPYRENHQAYINLIIDTMLPIVADEGLADYMDVFCEQGFYS